ncbi:MAG: sulfatase [Acidobacteria bacterium]|nr:sulfatase [Acidobacteriota bacterium]
MIRFIALVACLATLACRQAPHRPNVLVIVIDTLRADKLGCYGFPLETSPNMDRMAAQGIRFDDVIAPSSWTRPSMGSLFTGIYPRTLGIYRELGDVLGNPFTTLAEYLQGVGYKTFGMTANPNTNRVFNFDQGFETYVDSHVVFDWMGPDDQTSNQAVNRLNPARTIFKEANEWLKRQNNHPVYLQLTLMEVHEFDRGPLSLIRRDFRAHFRDQPEYKYLQTIKQVDSDIGSFVADLTSRPGWEDAIVVLVSDHGEGLDDHTSVTHARYHGYQLFESQVRVPWIIYTPDKRWGQSVITERVGLIDFTPTLLHLLNIPTLEGLDGRPLLNQDGQYTSGGRDYEITETYFRDSDKLAVYGSTWKYFENRDQWPGLDPQELYPRGVKEQGHENSQWTKQPQPAMETYLTNWESAFAKRPAVHDGHELSDAELEQLRALGYVQ